MQFTIQLPEKISLNSQLGRVHWTIRDRQNRDFQAAVFLAARQSQISAFSGAFPCHIEYRFKMRGRGLDSSNLAYMAKLVEDGLVHSGIIPDDSPKYVRSMTLVTEKGEDEVEVTISPSAATA